LAKDRVVEIHFKKSLKITLTPHGADTLPYALSTLKEHYKLEVEQKQF